MGWMNWRAVMALAIGWCVFGAPVHAGLTEDAQAPQVRLSSLSQLVIPSDLGQISQLLEAPVPSQPARRLILIEDAHVNYEGQKHLAAILGRLASAYGVSLILVEGGAGDVSLSGLRRVGSKAAREAVAEGHLTDGTFTGAEYLDAASDLALTLWGVEDMELYEEQYASYLAVERVREQASETLRRLRRLIEELRARSPNEPLQRFESSQASFAEGSLKFSDYAAYLAQEAGRLGVSLNPYAHLRPLIEATRLEPQLNQEDVSREQRGALERARVSSSDEAWDAFKEAAERHKAGATAASAYYEALEALLKEARVDLAAFPALSRYLLYTSLRARSGGRAWWTELAQLERELRGTLAGSPEARELADLADRAARCERLLELAWTAEDRAAAARDPDALRFDAWRPMLRARAAQAGLPMPLLDAVPLEQALSQGLAFYEITARRDEAIVQRALEKMDAAGQGTAILIAGGFHTGNLTERLASRGVEVAVVTPWAGEGDDAARYASILKAKYEQYQQRRAAH